MCIEVHTQMVDIEVVIMRTAGYFSLKWASEFSNRVESKIRISCAFRILP